MIKLLAIVGPTAVGKTDLSIKLAQKFNAEIISGDSMQVYRHLDIGTAKITPEEMAGVKHHLIDVRNIDERFSVADFVQDASKLIEAIHEVGKLPIIVGGTGFYLQALLSGLELGGDQYQNDDLRRQLLAEAKEKGDLALHQRLAKVDPAAARAIPVHNVRRVVRALEVYINTGHRFSDQHNAGSKYDAFVIGLTTDRALLYQRINQRVDQMMAQGLLSEGRWLYDHDGQQFQAGKGIGYRELFPYFQGQSTLEEAIELIKKDSRHYAKRQLTWFRNKTDPQPNWYNLVQRPNQLSEIESDVEKWLDDNNQ
ncbi:tRNA (adenosine(37)-N6)-dimethylallyltransferase MiaA [Lentilactobacillus buchneri]|uniref:tRNA dimethylallyltransferase n=1 Tax=Lentilactobacillus buchneri DSM 20057 TaxID=1423728 RepID=A0A4R5NPM6_LENBU|nr:tRNA (adenosine(37)-N6)-dimethylallyltransferase MiaA [Lentilactobacillus buchneri]KRK67706.1 tRNA dimethylallyltransferase [Lentilactobacillus buchneri DSM 20057]MCT3253448.1 tRNA (adenosine(37)-N6)-dimethylallyltransferase MiaA [Lentilactobacillus buchneri]MCT3548040.1 tRNA (adenosine(37)-N6)-dimethylallyltransferase MiaA [Lentilactobacillus buchneri]MCT4438508.1 tRNA (adenosine(37)-N6)-dimethylallyltransferase MiaA [Lentilactobacillus buchneri]MQM70614.1 tRNA (adenosine(37)-N6)-dimethyla